MENKKSKNSTAKPEDPKETPNGVEILKAAEKRIQSEEEARKNQRHPAALSSHSDFSSHTQSPL